MLLEDYTPTNVLAAMGLSELTPQCSAAGWAARLVLQPSFQPELCISLVHEEGAATSIAEVRTLDSQLWREARFAGPRPTHVSAMHVDRELATQALDFIVRPPAESRWTTLDGMSFHAFLQMPSGAHARTGQVGIDEDVRQFLSMFLPELMCRAADEYCKRALASALRSVPETPIVGTEYGGVVHEGPIGPAGWSPKKPKIFVTLDEALACAACSRPARRYRKLVDRLICLECGMSFNVDQEILSSACAETRDTS
jgi:hypothetical protein